MKPKPFLLSLLITAISSVAGYAQTHQHGHPGTDADAQNPPAMLLPKQAGQSAFAAIQEIVTMLSAQPDTDWSRVDIDALRNHLVDMNELTLNAKAVAKAIDNGIEINVTGTGRTLSAIQTMVPAHAAELNKQPHWQANAQIIPNGARLRVTSQDSSEVARIRALGFFGLMATGAHHQQHHLGIATGQMVH